MALKIERHLRFAWMEYEDHRDAVMMHQSFSSGNLGWRNLFLGLPSVRTVQNVNLLNQWIVEPPSGSVLEAIFNAFFSRPLKLPGSRISHKHALLNIQWLPFSQRDRRTQGLIMTPAANFKEVLDLNPGVFSNEPTSEDLHDINEFLNTTANEFLGRWLLNPGVKTESDSVGYLTFESDATDQADLVVASGHGGGGSVFGSMDGKRSWSQLSLSRIMRDNLSIPSTGRVKYLIVPGCTNCGKFAAEYWMPMLQKEAPYHGVLGYSGKYPGNEPGAFILKRFCDLIQKNIDLSIVEAWKKANAGEAYGAFVLTAAKNDTMRKWVSTKGLTVPKDNMEVTYFDPKNSRGIIATMKRDMDVIFHMADGRPIVEPANTVRHAALKQFGLIPGQAGSLEIKPVDAPRYGPGKKVRIVFYYWRPTKLRVDLRKLLSFDQSSGRIKFLTDQNTPEPPLKFDHPQPNNRVDAIEYTVGDSEAKGALLPYTVVADAHTNKELSSDTDNVFGRFHVGIALQDSNGKFDKYTEIYPLGAYLGSPKS